MKRNWKEYNKELKNRGSIFFYFYDDLEKNWYQKLSTGRKGSPFLYSKETIRFLHILRFRFRLTLRATQGFATSLFKEMGLELKIPDYTTLCRRLQDAKAYAVLPTFLDKNKPIHVVIDSTGLKVFGDGEWMREKHVCLKKRTWRKLHLAIDEKSSQIVSLGFSDKKIGDASLLPNIMKQVKQPVKQITGDGAYDTFGVYRFVAQHKDNPKVVVPPKQGAILRETTQENGLSVRNSHIIAMKRQGKKAWKEENKYHRRSLAETGMYRFKTLCGGALSSCKFESQVNEVYLKCTVLNLMKTPSVL